MAHTNSTTNYGLPQWLGSDKPTFLGDFNSAFNTIDTQMKSNADTAAGAAETASSANATAISANATAVEADGKATLATNTANAATTLAQSASDQATIAVNTANSAARAAQANNIENLAPAYDETRTYSVSEVVSYVDENNTGKLYKCVVAWNTPGAFNINYWDDITATAIFEQGYTLINDIVFDVTKTYRQNLYDSVYPVLLTLLPLAESSEDAPNSIKNSDIMLVWNTVNRFEKYMLDVYTSFYRPLPITDLFVFSRTGQVFAEADDTHKQSISFISLGQALNDNLFERVDLTHDRITDPGDNSIVTKTITPTITSLTYTFPPEGTHIRIYQRAVQNS